MNENISHLNRLKKEKLTELLRDKNKQIRELAHKIKDLERRCYRFKI